MSHAATNWAIKQRGLKPAAKIVLWHLADCHNGHTGQCNPRQSTLAYLCEMSRSTVNVHLAELERRGLIRRVTEVDKDTMRQRPTRYVLAMDGELSPPENGENPVSKIRTRPQDVDAATQDVAEPCPETGHGNGPKPCPDSGQSRVRNPDTYIEPWNRTRNICVSQSATHTDFDFQDFVDRFIDQHPRPGDPVATADALRKAIDAGAEPEILIGAAKSYRIEQEGNKSAFIAFSENWLEKGRWKSYLPKKKPSQADVDAMAAEMIKSGKRWLCTTMSSARARDLIAKGLVTVADCRKVGVHP